VTYDLVALGRPDDQALTLLAVTAEVPIQTGDVVTPEAASEDVEVSPTPAGQCRSASTRLIRAPACTRIKNLARWMKAAKRTVPEGIRVRRLAGSGGWIARSGSDATVTDEVEVTGDVVYGCGCLADFYE
jgi:hypothetical protein